MKQQRIVNLYKECIDNISEVIDYEPKFVMGEGNYDARVLLIGEAPGAQEEELGRPFVGKAGKNLDHFLETIGLERQDLFITNVVKIRPFKFSEKTGNKINRTPNTAEINYFRQFLHREIDIIQPEFIVTLGNIPLKGIYPEVVTIGNVHGIQINVSVLDRIYKLIPLYHPASVIYKRELVDVYEEDLKKLSQFISEE